MGASACRGAERREDPDPLSRSVYSLNTHFKAKDSALNAGVTGEQALSLPWRTSVPAGQRGRQLQRSISGVSTGAEGDHRRGVNAPWSEETSWRKLPGDLAVCGNRKARRKAQRR